MARTPTSTSRKRARASRPVDDPAAATVVYIHGIGSQPPPHVLKRQWDFALFDRDMGGRTRMAYWADLLHPATDHDELTRAWIDDDGDARSGAPARVRTASTKDASREAAYDEAVAARMLAHAREAAPRGYQGRVLPLPGFVRRWFTRLITRIFVRDTHAYFFDAEKRKAMQQRLRDALAHIEGKVVLIAHSQGSIIAYDVLHEIGASQPVQWITMGSPLGIDEVQDLVRRPLAAPKSVTHWHNFADPLDPVALDRGLANDFAPRGFVRDTRVENPQRRGASGFNPHAAVGYLAVPAVRGLVREWLGPVVVHSLGKPVVARDLAAVLAAPAERHKVLVELRQKDGERGARNPASLDDRRARLVRELERITGRDPSAAIDPLAHFVAAELTPSEIRELASRHGEAHVHRIWRNTRKRALISGTAARLHVDTARTGYRASGEGIGWAVLDTGIDAKHPHFATHDTIAARWDCTQRGAPTVPKKANDDADGHGTHVAGTIAGEGEERAGSGKGKAFAGMAPRTRLHVYKVLEDDGGDDSWIIKALDHIAHVNESAGDLVIHGVNLSLGGPFDAESYACGHSPLCQELRRLWQQGVVVCVAAGNEGALTLTTADGDLDVNMDLSVGDPANLEECIAVGSVHRDQPYRYGISYFSSRGPTADGRAKPDLVAPGERIVSCNGASRRGEPLYVEMSGTSMACPHVSGMIAAFLSVRREFRGRPEELKRLLLRHCTDLGRDRYHQGAGIPNLMKMLMET